VRSAVEERLVLEVRQAHVAVVAEGPAPQVAGVAGAVHAQVEHREHHVVPEARRRHRRIVAGREAAHRAAQARLGILEADALVRDGDGLAREAAREGDDLDRGKPRGDRRAEIERRLDGETRRGASLARGRHGRGRRGAHFVRRSGRGRGCGRGRRATGSAGEEEKRGSSARAECPSLEHPAPSSVGSRELNGPDHHLPSV
jgi:hypothetical protein